MVIYFFDMNAVPDDDVLLVDELELDDELHHCADAPMGISTLAMKIDMTTKAKKGIVFLLNIKPPCYFGIF